MAYVVTPGRTNSVDTGGLICQKEKKQWGVMPLVGQDEVGCSPEKEEFSTQWASKHPDLYYIWKGQEGNPSSLLSPGLLDASHKERNRWKSEGQLFGEGKNANKI